MGVSTPHFNAERQKESKTMAKTNTTIKMAEKTPEVTPASSKQSMAKYLADMVKNSAEVVNNTNLVARINYTLDAFKSSANNVPKTELSTLVDEVKAILSAPKKPVEASAKPLKKKSGAKTPEKTDDDEVKKTTDTAKKSPKKSEKAEKPAKTEDKVAPLAPYFPAEIEHPQLGKLIAVPDKYHSYKELYEALSAENPETIYVAAYWTERAIKECGYGVMCDVPAPKSFQFDLDILQFVLTCDRIDRAFALSVFTEAMFVFNGDDLTPIVDKDKNGKFNVRMSSGLEFELYVPADNTEEETDESEDEAE